MEESTHQAIFKGETVRKLYDLEKFYMINVYIKRTKYEHISWEDIHECILGRPLLNIDEEIYINELDKIVKVNKRIRTTNGEMIYYINNYNIIEDEKTKESNEAAEKKIKESEQEKPEQKEKSLSSVETKDEIKEKDIKKWWQFWK